MEDQNLTAAAIVSFSERLEDRSTVFYQELAKRLPAYEETFVAFAEQGQKNKLWVTRTYQETISDALEACFCFEGLALSNYPLPSKLADDVSNEQALAAASELEDIAIAFYLEAAERSDSLLATVPAAFRRVAKRRAKRKAILEAMRKSSTASC
jgi:rubrerythrin